MMPSFLSALLGAAAPLVQGQQETPREANIWFPVEASTVARGVDDVFYFVLWVSIVSFVIVIGAAVLFSVKYRAREGHQAEKTPSHDMRLEMTWTIVPTILVAIMFFAGFNGFINLRTPPRNSETVYVTAQKWNWTFRYANGAESAELVVPLGRPIKLVMTSVDVLHSLYIPAFRVKQDVVPGRYAQLWFEATREGDFHLFCTEYCGTNHSTMITNVSVVPEEQYQSELVELANFIDRMPPLEAGERVFKMKGCTQCHNTTADAKTGGGPGLAALNPGDARQFADGRSAQVDEEYIRRSILTPAVDVVSGFTPIMTPYQGRISEDELRVLIQYLLSLE